MTIELDNVELYFNEKRILNGIYIKAESGKITGILGSNGSGKSCILSIIFGDLTPKYKLIRIDGKPILKPFYQTKLIAYLPQYNFIPKHLKLKTAFSLFNVSWEAFVEAFENFKIYRDYKINRLSGGEKRLLETYLILKKPSEFVLLDEPFSHLSPLYIEKIKDIICAEKQHKAIIITDHMYQHIINVSETIYLLKNGSTKLIKELNELEDYNYLSVGTLT